MVGITVSHYKILEKLGEGGMGVVYRAHDTKLDRLVALKFLPHRVTAGEEEKSRFLQEARAASAVTHPNVCVIHEIAEYEAQQYIVMEYVDGKTLRHLVPVQKIQNAIDYAIQIGEALSEAHSKGVVHRDIKTDNIMVSAKNQVKVMDFGLAKLKGSLKLTRTSSTIGTLAYMAPEQIEGGEVDARSDIFSFGVVLYEMLTGHLPFRGEHEAAMVYSIVNEDPTPVQEYLPGISSELMHILDRVLEKDPEDRYQSVHDMVIDLRRLKKQTSRLSRTATAWKPSKEAVERDGKPVQSAPRRRRRLAIFLLIGAAVVCACAVLLLLPRRAELNPGMKFRALQMPFRNTQYGGMTADGNWVVFPAQDDRGKWDVYMMNISQGHVRRVTNDSSSYMVAASISPDAGTVLYTRFNVDKQDMQLVGIPSSGGQGRVVVDSADMGWFSPDGGRIYYENNNPVPGGRRFIHLWMCALDGSNRRLLIADTIADRHGFRFAFSGSPDEKFIAWTKNVPEGYTEILIRDLETGMDRQLTSDRKFADDPLWTPNGYIIYSSNRGGNVNLWMMNAGGGEPVQLTRGSGPDAPVGITADGRKLLYEEIQSVGHIKLASLRDGSLRQLTVDDRGRGTPSFSPTGKYVAFAAQEIDAVSMVMDIYVIDRDGGNVRKLTEDMSYKSFPVWSPDERWITYCAVPVNEPAESTRVYLIRTDKPGQARLIARGTYSMWFNERQFALFGGMVTSIASIDRDSLERFSEDSVYAVPILEEKYVGGYDFHKKQQGWWITTASSYKSSALSEAKRLGFSYLAAFAKGGKELFYWKDDSRELHRMRLPDGRDERVKGRFPGLGASFGIRSDGEEIVYRDSFTKSRFVLVENLFK